MATGRAGSRSRGGRSTRRWSPPRSPPAPVSRKACWCGDRSCPTGPRVRGVVMAGRDGRDVRVPAPLVIAADGRRSRLALPLGLARHPRRPRRWAIGAYFENVAGLTSFGEMHVRRGRYLGVARVPSGCANVCLVVPGRAWTRPGAGRAQGWTTRPGLLQRAIDSDPRLRERFAGARMMTAPVVLGPLAVDATAAGSARTAARRRRGGLHRSDDGRRPAVRGPRRRAGRRGRARRVRGRGSRSRTSASRGCAAASSPRSGASTGRCAVSSAAG